MSSSSARRQTSSSIVRDADKLLPPQRTENQYLVHSVEKFRRERGAERGQHPVTSALPSAPPPESPASACRLPRPIGGHDDHRVAEIRPPPLRVGQTAVVQHLQEQIEYVRVRLLHFVEQHHGIRMPPYFSVSCPPSSKPT